MTRIFTLIALCFFTIATTAQHIEKRIVYFGYEDHTITEAAFQQLDNTYQGSLPNTALYIESMGRVNSRKGVEHISELGKKRTTAIRNYFLAKGVNESDIAMRSIKPSTDKYPVTWRIEVAIHETPTIDDEIMLDPVQETPRIAPVTEVAPVFTDITSIKPKKANDFTISPDQPQVIRGKEGTVLTIPDHAFMFADGTEATENVNIELKEYYHMADMLMANLITTSKGRMIETGGMMHISAISEGREVLLKPGKSIQIELPTVEVKPGMQLFLGQEQSDGLVDWETATASISDNITSEINVNQNNWIRNENRNNLNFRGNRAWNLNRDRGLDIDKEAVENMNKMDSYVLNSTKLGWINCDRFYDVENKSNLTVDIDKKMKPAVRLIFKDIKSIMPGYYSGEKIVFSNIPVGQRATLIAFSIKDDQPYFTSKEVVITENGIEELSLAKTTMEAMEKNFAALN